MNTLIKRTLTAFSLLFLSASAFSQAQPAAPKAQSQVRVKTGLEVLLESKINLIAGKRVGLVTNQTGVNSAGVPTVDIFAKDKRFKLTALFAPEHGIRGDLKAGADVPDLKDPKTGLNVYSLHGKNGHRPTKEALAQIDVMVFDIQDVGSRTYTYIWHMAECMSGCAEAGKEIVVLDRPNPLGGITIDGPVNQKPFLCFIGLYPIPRVYGMTIGELALYLNVEEKINSKLTVVPMQGYTRNMSWKDTGLPWIPPSPNIPSPESAVTYAATGTMGELKTVNVCCGTPYSFQAVGVGWMDPDAYANSLNSQQLPGVFFQVLRGDIPTFNNGKPMSFKGIYIKVTDPVSFKPATTELVMIWMLQKMYPKSYKWLPERAENFDKAMGVSSTRLDLAVGRHYKNILQDWQKMQAPFIQKRQKYLLYK